MELSSEDALRLNVMLANPLQAVRIDESSMTVHALSEQGEASVRLNPRGRDDQYLKSVRELLSSQVLGSPGGYPVFLRRWTRMGQARDDSLEPLLLLGEPEAVVAVVHAAGLTDEIARRVLAEFLIDYLPFETEHRAMIETVRLVLQPGLIDAAMRDKLWRQARRRNSFYVGFMDAAPDDFPEAGTARADAPAVHDTLRTLVESGNPVARQLCRCLGAQGQLFLATAEMAMKKPTNQDVVVEFLKSLQRYFSTVCPNSDPAADMPTIVSDAEVLLDVPAVCPTTAAVQEVLALMPRCRADVKAMLALSWVGEPLVNPIFARTDAIGSVMRKKIEPVTMLVQEQLDQLRGKRE
jgi:hypothetical protein